MARFWWRRRASIARHLIHLGLWVMPDGRAKRDVLFLLWQWRAHVERAIAEQSA